MCRTEIAAASKSETAAREVLEALDENFRDKPRAERLELIGAALDFAYQRGLEHAQIRLRPEASSGTPWRNGDTWHCRCGAANTGESCTNCQRLRRDEWGDVP